MVREKSGNFALLKLWTPWTRLYLFSLVYFNSSLHSKNLKTGATGPLPGKKVGTLQKKVGPQVTTHLIGCVSPLLALISLVSGLTQSVH